MTLTTPHSSGYQRPVYIVDGARTPFLKASGIPGPCSAADLAVAVGQPLLLRQNFSPENLDEVIIGCVSPAATEANIARVISLRLSCGDATPAWTVQRNCASGMQALASAAERIAAGYAHLILAGGTEAMSHAPVLWSPAMVAILGAWQKAKSSREKLHVLSQLRLKNLAPVIGLLQGLTDPITNLSMGQTAENLATSFAISRIEMDRFALQSHQRLAAAIDANRLREIIPLYCPDGRVIEQDEGLRRDSSLDGLKKLKPVFDPPYGRVTAGNSAQITDGAALLILASEEAVNHYRLPVLGQLLNTAWSGLDPAQMGLGPVYAVDKLLQATDLVEAQIDQWEINEAFAAQVLACLAAMQDETWQEKALGHKLFHYYINEQNINLNGGAISIGHPVGASGARIVLTLLMSLQNNGGGLGIASLCIGGGQGGAMLVKSSVSG